MSPNFTYIRDIVSRDLLKWSAGALCLDTEKRRMYVADSEVKDDNEVKDDYCEVKDVREVKDECTWPTARSRTESSHQDAFLS